MIEIKISEANACLIMGTLAGVLKQILPILEENPDSMSFITSYAAIQDMIEKLAEHLPEEYELVKKELDLFEKDPERLERLVDIMKKS